MSLNIRHWVASRQIELDRLAQPSALVAGVAFRIVQDMETKSLTPFDICALAEVLELPLGVAYLAIEPISQICVWLMRQLSRKKPLKRNEGTWLTFQVAYLNALQRILEQEFHLRRPWIDRAVDFGFEYAIEKPKSLEINQNALNQKLEDDQQLVALLKTIRPGRLSDSQAEQALSLVADSFLVQQMNNTAVAWFVANGAEETEAKSLVQRLVHGLPGDLLAAIASDTLPLAQLQKFVKVANLVVGSFPVAAQLKNASAENREQNISEFSALNSQLTEDSAPNTENFPLNLQREYYRASLLQTLSQPNQAETFTLKDLYIPLKGLEIEARRSLAAKGLTRSKNAAKPVDLMEWATQTLLDTTSIAAIEANSGCGKTSFCQIFSARVAWELYPRWMPISIRLREATLGQTLEQTLDSAFPLGRFTDRDGWLSPNSPPCLLILDGLDELPLPSHIQTGRHIQVFLDQLVQFQKHHVASGEGTPRHKIFLTSAPSTIGQPEERSPQQCRGEWPFAPTPLKRIAIQPFEQDEFRQWFQQWSKLQSKSIAQGYFSFLKQAGVFRTAPTLKELAALISQPLMLYLLGLLHRDGLFDGSILQVDYPGLKFEIYDQIYQWLVPTRDAGKAELLHPVREGSAHACRSPEAIDNLLHNRTPQELRHQMQVAALNLVQSGQHQLRLGAVGANGHSPVLCGGDRDSTIALSDPDFLPAFFFRSSRAVRGDDRATLEFSHPNLGEYLCAQEIAERLKSLTEQSNDAWGEVFPLIQKPTDVAQHIYALLGYGVLSTEIEHFTIERLRRESVRSLAGFSLSVLFERLYQFYKAYCQGRWMDEGIAHQTARNLAALSNPLNASRVDAVVGINVFLLLCAIAKAAQIPFWPCGDPNVPYEFDPDRLLTLSGRAAVISPMAFWQRSRNSLSQVQLNNACLDRASIAQANLWQTNLSFASLVGTNLSGANLQETNLFKANLVGADLSGANLSGARLEGANLSGANLFQSNLTLANLTNTCLFDAKLDEQSKNMASSNGAIFSLEEFERYTQSLTRLEHPSGTANKGLVSTKSTVRLIESAEGEFVLPEYFPSNGADEDATSLEFSNAGNRVLLDESESSYGGETTVLEDPLNSLE